MRQLYPRPEGTLASLLRMLRSAGLVAGAGPGADLREWPAALAALAVAAAAATDGGVGLTAAALPALAVPGALGSRGMLSHSAQHMAEQLMSRGGGGI